MLKQRWLDAKDKDFDTMVQILCEGYFHNYISCQVITRIAFDFLFRIYPDAVDSLSPPFFNVKEALDSWTRGESDLSSAERNFFYSCLKMKSQRT